MSPAPQLLLIGAVAVVGVLHTIVPDHWVPIAVIARQRGWSKSETARAALQAGTGHVASTLAIALIVWITGASLATRLGRFIDTASSLALIVFGLWIATSSWHQQHHDQTHQHRHGAALYDPKPATGSDRARQRGTRVALLLILGSSPMVEGIPAFFAAGKYGGRLIAVMAIVFAASTIATYILLCVHSAAGLQRLRFGVFERYGEVWSWGAIALVGIAFWLWPVG